MATRASKVLSTETLHRTYGCLNRAVRRAMAQDLVRRNVVDVAEVPRGRVGRPSKSLTPGQVDAVLTLTVSDRLHNYVLLSLLTGARTDEPVPNGSAEAQRCGRLLDSVQEHCHVGRIEPGDLPRPARPAPSVGS